MRRVLAFTIRWLILPRNWLLDGCPSSIGTDRGGCPAAPAGTCPVPHRPWSSPQTRFLRGTGKAHGQTGHHRSQAPAGAALIRSTSGRTLRIQALELIADAHQMALTNGGVEIWDLPIPMPSPWPPYAMGG